MKKYTLLKMRNDFIGKYSLLVDNKKYKKYRNVKCSLSYDFISGYHYDSSLDNLITKKNIDFDNPFELYNYLISINIINNSLHNIFWIFDSDLNYYFYNMKIHVGDKKVKINKLYSKYIQFDDDVKIHKFINILSGVYVKVNTKEISKHKNIEIETIINDDDKNILNSDFEKIYFTNNKNFLYNILNKFLYKYIVSYIINYSDDIIDHITIKQKILYKNDNIKSFSDFISSIFPNISKKSKMKKSIKKYLY